MGGTMSSPARHAAVRAVERPVRSRLAGVDAARGLAVLGMIVVHVAGTAVMSGGPGGWVLWLAEGRSAILFAVLAGVSLGLLSGGRRGLAEHRAGERSQRDRVRIAVRAAVLFALGLVLAAISTGPMVILAFYAVMFVLVLPLLWLRPAALLAWAAGWALVGPQVSFVLRRVIETNTIGGAVAPSDLTSWGEAGEAALRLLLTGAYPVATWMPFVLLGLAVGRLDLRSSAVQVRLAVAGVGAAAIGYGGSWLAVDVLGGRDALVQAVTPVATESGLPVDQLVAVLTQTGLGTTGITSPAFLLIDGAHSGTTFEIVGSAGVAVAVLGVCLRLADRGGRSVAPVLQALAAAGALAASLYSAHIVAIALLDGGLPGWQTAPWVPTVLFLAGAVALAVIWRRLVGRGPAEWLLHILSTRAARVRS
jgi:uncharacterized membrane protein YeiB